jgi:nuclear pore complex protein Nup98-Nup96
MLATPSGRVTLIGDPPTFDVRPIKPNLVRHPLERCEDNDEDAPAPASLVPRLSRPEYYSDPSIEKMSTMSEAQLSRLDNLVIGRYGFGSVRWPGLSDVRQIDFDDTVVIEQGSLTLYPDRAKPKVGEELNKEAVVTLHVKPSRTDIKVKSVEILRSRLAKISEEFGGRFISYDMEKWIFRVPHFNGLDEPAAPAG